MRNYWLVQKKHSPPIRRVKKRSVRSSMDPDEELFVANVEEEKKEVQDMDRWQRASVCDEEINNYAINLTQNLHLACINQKGKTSSLVPDLKIKNLDVIMKSNRNHLRQIHSSKTNDEDKPVVKTLAARFLDESSSDSEETQEADKSRIQPISK